jgi:hypothetical protein
MKTDVYKNMTVGKWIWQRSSATAGATYFLLPQWSAAHAADEILTRVARNKAMIVFPWFGRVYWRLHRIVPASVYWVMLQRMTMFRKTREICLASHQQLGLKIDDRVLGDNPMPVLWRSYGSGRSVY